MVDFLFREPVRMQPFALNRRPSVGGVSECWDMSRLLTKRQLNTVKGIPYHPEHIMRLVRQGKFPAPFRLNDSPTSRVFWREEEIDAYIDRMASSTR